VKHTHEIPQLQEVQDQIGDISEHIRQHREKYLFGAGIITGVFACRFLGRPQVVVVNHIIQGAPSG
jgi:hypothetical protein